MPKMKTTTPAHPLDSPATGRVYLAEGVAVIKQEVRPHGEPCTVCGRPCYLVAYTFIFARDWTRDGTHMLCAPCADTIYKHPDGSGLSVPEIVYQRLFKDSQWIGYYEKEVADE